MSIFIASLFFCSTKIIIYASEKCTNSTGAHVAAAAAAAQNLRTITAGSHYRFTEVGDKSCRTLLHRITAGAFGLTLNFWDAQARYGCVSMWKCLPSHVRWMDRFAPKPSWCHTPPRPSVYEDPPGKQTAGGLIGHGGLFTKRFIVFAHSSCCCLPLVYP